MELSRQMLLLTAVNYGSYYLHITKVPHLQIIVVENFSYVIVCKKVNELL